MIVLAAAMLFILGCSGDPVKLGDDHGDHFPSYKSLTAKENLIYNLTLCYKKHDLPRYEELLDQQFLWHNQDETFYDRATDVTQTGKMFAAAEHTYPELRLWLDKLELWISNGTWTAAPMVDEVACIDCWETTREYYLTAIISGGATTYVANAQVRFIAIGVTNEASQKIYVLRHIYDMPK
jgi:hypothetical protein